MIIESLYSDYSTTRRLTRAVPVLRGKLEAKFEAQIFCPHHPERKGEGGLRRLGYFKSGGSSSQNYEDATSHPLVTVITVVFNGAGHLERAILSVLNQTYDNIEYIVVDGGSSDESLEIIRKYEHAIDYWVSEPDAGIYDAWNKGVQLSHGEWMAFLGADDSYLDGAIQTYVASIESCQENPPEYISSRVNLTSESRVLRTIGEPWRWSIFRNHMNVAHVGSLHSRALFEKHGLFDTGYRICGDYELLLRPRSGLRAAYINAVTASMAIGGLSDSNPLVFRETTRAKTTTGGRSKLMSLIETLVAVCKWKLRKWLSH